MMSGMVSRLVSISTFTVADGLADTVAATEWPGCRGFPAKPLRGPLLGVKDKEA
jgi:hypothetical protein